MSVERPLVSIIIPVYNGEHKLPLCLDSIRTQDYPQDKLEIIIVDDDSTDRTVEIATNRYGCRIVRNGTHNPERGKSIGIENAKGEYLFFVDDDNILPNDKWLRKLITAVVKEDCVGGQVAKFTYDKNASFPDRYMALFGCGDPAVFYLHKRDHMMKTEKKWKLGGNILKETKDYFKIKFDVETLPTIGSQGFLIKKSYLDNIKWSPYYFHIDANADLIRKGFDEYIILKDTVVHNHSKDCKDFIGKMKRNSKQLNSDVGAERSYSYNLTPLRLVGLGLTLGTLIIPIKDSIVGFIKFPSTAWFFHPVVCFRTAVIYTMSVLKNKNMVSNIK